MAYTPNTWVARAGTGLNRFSYVMDGDYIYLTPAPVSVQDPGTPFSVDWMNNIEQGITDAQNPDSLSVGETMPTGLGSGAVNAADGFYVSGSPIIDSGNNENGNWVKFSDGTMICYAKITATISSSYQGTYYAGGWHFPLAFIEIPVVLFSAKTYPYGLVALDDFSASATGNFTIQSVSTTPTLNSSTITFSMCAIGRWK